MTPQQLAAFITESKAAIFAQTAGPWHEGLERPNVGLRACDVAFIAHARSALPAALAELEAMQKDLAELREEQPLPSAVAQAYFIELATLRKIRAAAEAWQKDRIETQDGEYDHLNTCELALIEALK